MKPLPLVLVLSAFLAASAAAQTPPANTLSRLLRAPLHGAEGETALPDPPPEEPSPFPRGFRPEPWESWEVPAPLHRVGLGVFVGSYNFLPALRAFKMDNPDLVLTSSEDVPYENFWKTNSIALSLEASLAIMPLLSLTAEASFYDFRRETSPPTTYLSYQDDNNYQQLLSTGNLNIVTFLVSARFAFPLNRIFSEPELLLQWRDPEGRSGLVPVLLGGLGVCLIQPVEANVYRVTGGAGTSENRPFYRRSTNPAAMLGLGLEYRFSVFGASLRARFTYCGEPVSGFAPYTDAASFLITYVVELGVAVHFF